MKKIIKSIIGVLVATTIASQSIAQDFYNGFKGPRASQIDTYVNHSGRKTNAMLIPKLFTRNLNKSLPDMLIASPFSISEGKAENKGVNLGHVIEKGNTGLIAALGLFKDSEGNYRLLNPQIYLTHIHGKWTFDLEGNLPIHLSQSETAYSTSATLGWGINDRLRVGGSIIKEKGSSMNYGANVRIELTKNHQYWFQGYARRNAVGARLASNF